VIAIVIALTILAAFAGTLAFLWQRAQVPEAALRTERTSVRDIVVKTVATGSVIPCREVAIKSAVSGVIATLGVEAGDIIEGGDLIATIRIVPNAEALARAESTQAQARIQVADLRRDRDRVAGLVEAGAASLAELEVADLLLAQAEETGRAARELLQIVREGASGGDQVAPEVRSTVSGVVLDVPVEVGGSVIEANTFNDGTTIAAVADMDDMIFEGRVDESEVGRIAEGMALDITIGALDDRRLEGSLEHIAPKGVDDAGAVQFPIRAALALPDGVFVRAGLSANADIVLDRREDVLAVREALLQYEGDQAFVEVLRGENTERVQVEVGTTDGIFAEVIDGITSEDVLVVPSGAGAPARR
jgi:HlyD family secretion protein